MAEIYGSFGRVISGSSLSGSIGNLSRQIMYDKIRRIFSAYRDEVTYDGALLDAATAINKLNDILGMVDPSSEAASDIKGYIDAIRQEDRTRRANKALNELDTQDSSKKDYAKLIKSLQEILADPSITESERQALKAQVSNGVRNLINNALKQYYEGGSITVDGKTIDLSLKGGGDQLLAMISAQMTAFPDMANDIGKSYDIAKSTVIVKEADFAFASLSLKTDSEKLKAYQDRIKSYESALEVLKKSNYDLSESGEALELMNSIQDINENITALNKNLAITSANNRVEKLDKSIGNEIGKLDEAGRKLLGGSRAQYLSGDVSLFDALVGLGTQGIDTLFDYVDAMVAENGGSTTFTSGGQTFDLTHDGVKKLILGAARTSAEASRWASGNDNVSATVQKNFKEVANALGGFITGKELFAIEDQYDAARSRLEREVKMAGGDIFAIRAAYKDYGTTLNTLAAKNSDSTAANNLRSEGYFYINGTQDPNSKAEFFSVWSGNQDIDDANAAIAVTQDIILDTLTVSPSKIERYIGINGEVSYGISGRTEIMTEFGPVNPPAWTAAKKTTVLTGLRLKDPLGGPANVYQTVAIRDKSNKVLGFVAVVNGKFVGAQKNSNNTYTFYKSSELNAALSGLVTPANIAQKLTEMGGTAWLQLDAGLSAGTTGEQWTVEQLRTGKVILGVNDESGAGDITAAEKEEKIAEILSEYSNDQFSYEGALTRGEGMSEYDVSGLIVTVDGEKYNAVTLLGRAAAQEALQNWIEEKTKSTIPDPAPGVPGGPTGSTNLDRPNFAAGAGAGMGWTPAVNRATSAALAGASANVNRGMESAEAAYNLRRTKLQTGTQAAAPELRDSRPPTPVKPVTGTTPVTPVKPVGTTGTTTSGIKPMSVSTVSTVKSVAGDSLAERLAQARRLNQSRTARQGVGGFFRNSPFKIEL